MARGAAKKASRSSGGSGRSKPTGIEKYGKDEVDEFLDLDAGEDEPTASESDINEEEEIMGIDAGDEEDEHAEEEWAPQKVKSSKAKASAEDDEDGDEATKAAGSKGWRRNEFYGGEDAGDDSDIDSDEDLIFEEAQRLEKIRAQQLTGEEDVLAALLAAPAAAEDAAPKKASKEPKPSGVATSAHFESVFEGETETISTPRDISKLPIADRKRILKKEAPELMPLLADFKMKLAGLKEILPLLQPHVLKRLPTTGAAYLEAKAALMLNTLANLSFYLLLRAEGGAVKAHPVVPQLVWLRELHEQLAPLDEKLSKKVKKAVGVAKQVPQIVAALEEPNSKQGVSTTPRSEKRFEPAQSAPQKKTLRERLERLASVAAPAVGRASSKRLDAKENASARLLTKDLLRLPKSRPTAASGSASAPADLDDIDPSLGVWAPRSTLGEQLSSVQQQMREHANRAKAANASADTLVEPKPRKARERKDNLHKDPEDLQDDLEGMPAADTGGDEDEPDLIKSARLIAATRKDSRNKAETARADAKEEARKLRQFHPEKLLDGPEDRRKTSKRILDNRGLQRIRKKHAGNARVANKEKYNKAIKRRKGAVQEMREGADDGATYGGEATGIRTHVRKSMKIG
jgi:U3 small nucleolar RNA-associated protein 3